MEQIKGLVARYSAIFWSRGGLHWKELVKQLFIRSRDHQLTDRAALLSFYFLIALFPLLIVLSTLVGFLLASEAGTYRRLLSYLDQIMPGSAFDILRDLLEELTSGASGGRLSLSALVSLWGASSALRALIETLNVAFDVPNSRSWWHRRSVAIGLTLGIGLLLASALAFLFASSAAVNLIETRLPMLKALGRLSDAVRWLVGVILLLLSLTLVYAFGPNLNRKRWEGILPGACLALVCWFAASWALRLYLSTFNPLNHSYGSLAGVIALLFWLYLSAAAIVLGGELNAIIWHATGDRP